jgi:hypothetical protein
LINLRKYYLIVGIAILDVYTRFNKYGDILFYYKLYILGFVILLFLFLFFNELLLIISNKKVNMYYIYVV